MDFCVQYDGITNIVLLVVVLLASQLVPNDHYCTASQYWES